jgi:hypothetical protein
MYENVIFEAHTSYISTKTKIPQNEQKQTLEV